MMINSGLQGQGGEAAHCIMAVNFKPLELNVGKYLDQTAALEVEFKE